MASRTLAYRYSHRLAGRAFKATLLSGACALALLHAPHADARRQLVPDLPSVEVNLEVLQYLRETSRNRLASQPRHGRSATPFGGPTRPNPVTATPRMKQPAMPAPPPAPEPAYTPPPRPAPSPPRASSRAPPRARPRPRPRAACVEINQCVGCTKSFRGDDAAGSVEF